MHFRAPRRNLAITLLLTSVAGCNDEQPDTTSDGEGTGTTATPIIATTPTTATGGTITASTASGGGTGSQAEEADDPDDQPNDVDAR